MKVRVEKVLDKDLVYALYKEVRESPFKVPSKSKKLPDSLLERIGKFNQKHYPFFEATLKMPSHRSNGYDVEIFTFCRYDIRSVI